MRQIKIVAVIVVRRVDDGCCQKMAATGEGGDNGGEFGGG
jgi:hypothetical protein